MADGFTHEYEGSSGDEAASAPAKPAARTPKQQAATAKALEALSRKRAEAAAAKESKTAPAAAPAKKPAPAPAPPAAAGGAGAGAASPSPPPNPLAHAAHERPAYDPIMIAEIVKREVELQRLREKEIGWDKAKRGGKSRRRRRAEPELDSSTDDDEDASASSEDDHRPSRKLTRRSRKPVNVVPDPRDGAGSNIEFFDKLMGRNTKFNPW
jgi:hypothetical protein